MTILQKTTLKQQAYDIIKQRILSQSYRLGEKINIDSLAQELSISNSPIREALTMLEKDGLVTTSPNTGTRVVEFTESEILELNQTISILLLGAYDICIAQDKMDELIACMKKQLQLQHEFNASKDHINEIKHAICFDRCFVSIAGNKHLISLYDQLSNILSLAVFYDQQTRDINRTKNIKEHDMILNALMSENHDEVKSLIISHYNKL